MANIFNREVQQYAGGFRADKGIITAAGGLSGLMMQSLTLQYQRPITKVYELGVAGNAANVYYVEGKPQGNVNVAHIVGFNFSVRNFYAAYGDACSPKSLALNVASAQCPAPATAAVSTGMFSVLLNSCVISSIGMSVQAQNLIINENSVLEFADLSYTGD
jgi:hypothetical protein